VPVARESFTLEFQAGTLKHLGLQMYSTLPPVLGELVANAWDADSPRVSISIPETRFGEDSQIEVRDWGHGMTDEQVQEQYLQIGRDRRAEDTTDMTVGRAADPKIAPRPVMGRKGIGKFSPFGIAKEIEIETVRDGITSRFVMDYDQIMKAPKATSIEFKNLPATGEVTTGTRVILRRLQRYRTQSPSIQMLRRGLARRFSVIADGLEVIVNGSPITLEERDLRKKLDVDADGKRYLWEYEDVEVQEGTGWTVSGWIGALKRTDESADGIQRGIAIMARGKLVQDPWVFDATVGQQYALSYLVGELSAEFVDAEEDTVATSRNTLVWDTEANRAFKAWGVKEVNRIARLWADRRGKDNERSLEQSPMYQLFVRESAGVENVRARRAADKLIRETLKANPAGDDRTKEATIRMCIDYLKFDAFVDLANDLAEAEVGDPAQLLRLFREWEIVEAREMMRVTEGRIRTIQRLQQLIDQDALEVPTLHNFLREFPWVLDPRWNLIADERRLSTMLREQFPDEELQESDRRIDFLCVREGRQLIVVEIKRPGITASSKELAQVEEYVHFMRDLVARSTDPDLATREVVGYLLVGGVVDKGTVRQKVASLAQAKIYVRTYEDLLEMVKRSHSEFLERYRELREAVDGKPDPVAQTQAA
jgi:Histidine kinase-, DNA gyrase B-, and HSP90-like ATPase